MLLEELNITEEKFLEYLETYIEEHPVDEALREAGLLPYETTFQVKPKIIKSSNLNTNEVFSKDSLEIKFKENITRNRNLEFARMITVEEGKLENDKDNKNPKNNSLAA